MGKAEQRFSADTDGRAIAYLLFGIDGMLNRERPVQLLRDDEKGSNNKKRALKKREKKLFN